MKHEANFIFIYSTGTNADKLSIKVNVFGGDPSFIGALSVLDLKNPEANGEVYNNWASSVEDFPNVINQKVKLAVLILCETLTLLVVLLVDATVFDLFHLKFESGLQLRPLYELVKEVQCAGLKKLHLKRAMEEYLAEQHPCHCQPCQNNGEPLLTGTSCRCACRPGTSGPACGTGAVTGEQPGKKQEQGQ